MTTVPVQERMTADEFLAIPYGELPRFSELVDGEVIVNEASPHHSVVQGNLYYAFRRWMSASPGRGQVFTPIDVAMDERNVFGPDLSWYSARNSLDLDSPGPSGRPDLAAEVRSPSTWSYDIGAKKTTYERLGLPELWLVDTPADEVLVFRRSTPGSTRFDIALELGRGEALGSPLLPGFRLDVDVLFDLT